MRKVLLHAFMHSRDRLLQYGMLFAETNDVFDPFVLSLSYHFISRFSPQCSGCRRIPKQPLDRAVVSQQTTRRGMPENPSAEGSTEEIGSELRDIEF